MNKKLIIWASAATVAMGGAVTGCSGQGDDALVAHRQAQSITEYPTEAPAPEPEAEPAPQAASDYYMEPPIVQAPPNNQEAYDGSEETGFKSVATAPLSTFSADVDTASYANLRRQLTQGQYPQGIRIEELVNYFDYDYPAPGPDADRPFSVTTEVAPCPWNPDNQLAMIGVQATRAIPTSEGNNIVLLADVSGSMNEPNRLPLLIESFTMLVENLGRDDVVSIVTYAGTESVVADSVPGDHYSELAGLLRGLEAGGSTAGAAGIATAYDLARKNFIRGGNNRVILATDGDFNVGPSTPDQLIDLIERERQSGIYISVLGFGMGNLKDNMMEAIADHGNGNYAYIDTANEARKVLVKEFDSTMFVVAQDLKLQLEFNPATVEQYRLIGYNNRRLENEDFVDDSKDAGDVGAGHSVTAFYELVAVDGVGRDAGLRYQATVPGKSTDLFTVAVRYKLPGATSSVEAQFPAGPEVVTARPSDDFRFASAVAELGLIATDSNYKARANLGNLLERAADALGEDPYGLRHEFLNLVDAYAALP